MPKKSMPLGQAEATARQVAGEFGFELLEVELVKEPTGRFLRFYIDKTGGITLDDCEAYHRKIHPLMDEIDYDYMEVSSPGADRPLKKEADFARAEGILVEVRLFKPISGSKIHTGKLLGLRNGSVVIEDASGAERTFVQKEVALVKPVIDFDEEDLLDEIPVSDNNEE